MGKNTARYHWSHWLTSCGSWFGCCCQGNRGRRLTAGPQRDSASNGISEFTSRLMPCRYSSFIVATSSSSFFFYLVFLPPPPNLQICVAKCAIINLQFWPRYVLRIEMWFHLLQVMDGERQWTSGKKDIALGIQRPLCPRSMTSDKSTSKSVLLVPHL